MVATYNFGSVYILNYSEFERKYGDNPSIIYSCGVRKLNQHMGLY